MWVVHDISTISAGYLEKTLTNYVFILRFFYFNNTITQDDVDEVAGKKGESYTIEGICLTEDGEYQTAALDGKSGTLSIDGDINNANFSYKLTNFFQDDEVFYVKVKIGQEEKIQKLIIVQGDIVMYEECFIGINYNGEWSIVEDSNCRNNKYMHTETMNDYLEFTAYGSGLDLESVLDETTSSIHMKIYIFKEDNTTKLVKSSRIETTSDEKIYERLSQRHDLLYFRSSKERDKYFLNITNSRTDVNIQNPCTNIDAIYIYK